MSRDEIVAIVDKNNQIVGSASRERMRAEGLRHRATYILVFDAKNRMFVHRRTSTKDVYPGHYDIAAGGVVLAGETYAASAERELAEELGISGTPLKTMFDFYHADGLCRVWGRVFTCRWDGPIVMQAEEIQSGEFMPTPDIIEMSRHKPFTPDGLYVLQRYLAT